MQSLKDQKSEQQQLAETADYISFGEFVTVMWSIKKEDKKQGVLKMEDLYQSDIINIKVQQSQGTRNDALELQEQRDNNPLNQTFEENPQLLMNRAHFPSGGTPEARKLSKVRTKKMREIQTSKVSKLDHGSSVFSQNRVKTNLIKLQ